MPAGVVVKVNECWHEKIRNNIIAASYELCCLQLGSEYYYLVLSYNYIMQLLCKLQCSRTLYMLLHTLPYHYHY